MNPETSHPICRYRFHAVARFLLVNAGGLPIEIVSFTHLAGYAESFIVLILSLQYIVAGKGGQGFSRSIILRVSMLGRNFGTRGWLRSTPASYEP